MSLIDKVRGLPTPILVLFIASKLIIGVGLGVLLASCIAGLGWWIVIVGVLMSVPGALKIFSK